VTIASRPSVWDGTVRISELIWVTGEGKYFCVGDWTGFLADSPPGKSIDPIEQFTIDRHLAFSRRYYDNPDQDA